MMERIQCSDTAMMTKPKEHGAMAKPMVAAARMSGISTWPFGLSSRCRFDVWVCMSSPQVPRLRGSVLVESFADHLFALLPQRSCALRIKGVGLYARAYARCRGDLGHVTVFAIAAADGLGIGDTSGPHGGRRALRNALIAKGGRTFGLPGIDLRDRFLQRLGRQVPTELGSDTPWVHRRRPHPTRLVPPIELDCKQQIGGLGATVGNELLVGRMLKVRIFKIDIRISVSRGRQVHQPRSGLQQRSDAVDEDKVSQG